MRSAPASAISLSASGYLRRLLGTRKAGAKIPRPPGPMQHGTTHIAFIEDPDGYKIELIGLDTMGSGVSGTARFPPSVPLFSLAWEAALT